MGQGTRDFVEHDAERGSGIDTLTDWVRRRARGVIDPAAHFLSRLGIHPDTVTVVGFLLQLAVGGLFFLGRIRLGGWLLSIVAPLDALDGAVARAIDQDGPFGAFLDSTLDRVSDAALILGLVAHHLQQGALVEVTLLLVALVAAFMVSYTRARAESLGVSCKVGVVTRLERVGLIAGLSALGLSTLLAWLIAILSVITFLQRVVHVYLACSRPE